MPNTLTLAGCAFWCEHAPDWTAALALLRGRGDLPDTPLPVPAPQWLAGAERRRAAPLVALSLELARTALSASGVSPAAVEALFASARGDVTVTDALCHTLAQDPRLVSPTRFHHSVHNAAAGYWGVATGNMRPASALAAHDHTLGAALLEALLVAQQARQPVLLVSADLRPPPRMEPLVPTGCAAGVALVLLPGPADSDRIALRWSVVPGPAPAAASDTPLERALAGSAQPDLPRLLRALAAVTHNADVAAPHGTPSRGVRADLPLGPGLHLSIQWSAAAPCP